MNYSNDEGYLETHGIPFFKDRKGKVYFFSKKDISLRAINVRDISLTLIYAKAELKTDEEREGALIKLLGEPEITDAIPLGLNRLGILEIAFNSYCRKEGLDKIKSNGSRLTD